MSIQVNTVNESFPIIPSTAKLAILLPTIRWSPLSRSIIGSMIGIASEEIVVLIGDNSENENKRIFLNQIKKINPYIFSVSHKNNIGSFKNICFLHDWSKDLPYTAIMADDDWKSPGYHISAYRFILDNPSVSCCSVGTSFIDIGDGNLILINQPSMIGTNAFDRIQGWDPLAARMTMYNTSKRAHLDHAIEYHKKSPLHGTTLIENLWELSRISQGDFCNITGEDIYVHRPATRSLGHEQSILSHNLLYKDAGIDFTFVHFSALSTAIQCAMFLKGSFSPIENLDERDRCAQHVFSEIFVKQFMPVVSAPSSKDIVDFLFKDKPSILEGFSSFCYNKNIENTNFCFELLNWFVEILEHFESKKNKNYISISNAFKDFALQTLANDTKFC